jgi:hypothetical protein
MRLVSAPSPVSAIPVVAVVRVPLVTRIVAGLSRAAVNLDPVVDAVPILPVRLPPTALQIAGMYCGCEETDKKNETGKDDRPILAGIHSKHGAVSNGVPSDV